MSKLNIKTGDTVLVIAGKDNGKVSTVKSVSPKTHKVVVEGVNILTKEQTKRVKSLRLKDLSKFLMLWLFAQLVTKQLELLDKMTERAFVFVKNVAHL